MSKHLKPLMVLSLGCFTASNALAADFDGSKPLICTATEVVDCALFDGCQRTTPQTVNLPRFLHLDFDKKKSKVRAARLLYKM